MGVSWGDWKESREASEREEQRREEKRIEERKREERKQKRRKVKSSGEGLYSKNTRSKRCSKIPKIVIVLTYFSANI